MPVITIPKVLREKLSDEGVDALVELINKSNDRVKEDVITLVDGKYEKGLALVEEKFERRLAEEIGKVRSEMTVEIGKVRAEISEAKAELIKWTFIFIVGQFWAIVGTLFVFFRR